MGLRLKTSQFRWKPNLIECFLFLKLQPKMSTATQLGSAAVQGTATSSSVAVECDIDARALLHEARQVAERFGHGLQLLTWIRTNRERLARLTSLLTSSNQPGSTTPSSTSSCTSKAFSGLDLEVWPVCVSCVHAAAAVATLCFPGPQASLSSGAHR